MYRALFLKDPKVPLHEVVIKNNLWQNSFVLTVCCSYRYCSHAQQISAIYLLVASPHSVNCIRHLPWVTLVLYLIDLVGKLILSDQSMLYPHSCCVVFAWLTHSSGAMGSRYDFGHSGLLSHSWLCLLVTVINTTFLFQRGVNYI